MLVYTRNALLSLRNSLKAINGTSHGSLPRPLSSELWQRLKFYNLLAPARGQRGGNHRRRSSGTAITVFESNVNRRTKQRGERNGVNYSNLLNIQIDTSNVSGQEGVDCSVSIRANIGPRKPAEKLPKIKNLDGSFKHQIIEKQRSFSSVADADERKGFDVLAISESWLNSTVSNAEVEISGYKLFRQVRLRKKGGVCVCLHSNFAQGKSLKGTLCDFRFWFSTILAWNSTQKAESFSVMRCLQTSRLFCVLLWWRFHGKLHACSYVWQGNICNLRSELQYVKWLPGSPFPWWPVRQLESYAAHQDTY